MRQAEHFHSRRLQISAGPLEVDDVGERTRIFKVVLNHQAPLFFDSTDGIRDLLNREGYAANDIVFDWLYAMETPVWIDGVDDEND
jgi:hypothetical protein